MSKVKITITSPAPALKDAASVWRRAEAGNKDIVPSIGFGSPSELFAAITDRPLELRRHVASHEARTSTNSPRHWDATTRTSIQT